MLLTEEVEKADCPRVSASFGLSFAVVGIRTVEIIKMKRK